MFFLQILKTISKKKVYKVKALFDLEYFFRFSFKICSLSPTLRRWKIVIFSENYKCIGEILRGVVNSKQGNLRYRLNLVFHPSMTRSAEAKEFTQSVLTQWKDDIAGRYSRCVIYSIVLQTAFRLY